MAASVSAPSPGPTPVLKAPSWPGVWEGEGQRPLCLRDTPCMNGGRTGTGERGLKEAAQAERLRRVKWRQVFHNKPCTPPAPSSLTTTARGSKDTSASSQALSISLSRPLFVILSNILLFFLKLSHYSLLHTLSLPLSFSPSLSLSLRLSQFGLGSMPYTLCWGIWKKPWDCFSIPPILFKPTDFFF